MSSSFYPPERLNRSGRLVSSLADGSGKRRRKKRGKRKRKRKRKRRRKRRKKKRRKMRMTMIKCPRRTVAYALHGQRLTMPHQLKVVLGQSFVRENQKHIFRPFRAFL